jgi:hypothetical protein
VQQSYYQQHIDPFHTEREIMLIQQCRQFYRGVLFVALLGLTPLNLLGQTHATHAEKSSVIETPFDTGWTKIPAGFRGNNTVLILSRLQIQEKQKAKSEYETSAQVEARVQAILAKPIVGRVTRTSDLSVVCTECVQSVYDAENKVLETTVTIDDELLISRHTEDRGSYIGTNGFGARVEVDKFNEVTNTFRFANTPPPYTVSTPMSAQQARSVKSKPSRLKAIVIYQPSSEGVTEAHRYEEATFDIAAEGDRNNYYLNAVIHEVWLYDSTTGEVLKRTTPTN